MSDQEKEMQPATAEESVRKDDTKEELSSETAATKAVTTTTTTTTTVPPAGRVCGRNRRRVVNDDDDEDEDDKAQNENKDVKVTDVKENAADNNNKADDDDDDDDDKPRRGAGRLKAASAAKIRAAAPSAPVAPPVAPPKIPSALHVDPSIVNNNNNNNSSTSNNSVEGIGGENNRGVGGSKVRFAISEPHAAAMYNVEMVYKMDFDALTYAEMLKIVSCITPHEVENKLAEREQEVQLIRQQKQSQRVEHFLDFYTNTAMSNGTNTNHNNNNNNGYSNGEAASLTSSSSSTAHNNAADNNTDATTTAAVVNGSSSCSAENADGQTKVINMSGYTYNVMLSRLYDALNRSHEGSAMTERNQLPTPIMEKIGKKKTVISNFGRICKAFHREMDDVKDFIEKELSITGNLDSNNALILKYEIRKATDFDNILVKYLEEYVKCNACHRIDTTLTKEGRRTELKCNWCTATRTVQAMGTATFRAALEKRSRQRATLTL